MHGSNNESSALKWRSKGSEFLADVPKQSRGFDSGIGLILVGIILLCFCFILVRYLI